MIEIEFLDSLVDSKTLLAFCQTNRVEVLLQNDLMYHCFINYSKENKDNRAWAVELDAYSAMVIGVYQFLEFEKKSAKL